MDRALTWFIGLWVGLVLALNLLGIGAMLATAESFGVGLSRVWSTFSPFNVVNYLLEVVLLSPAIAAHLWRGRRRKREQG